MTETRWDYLRKLQENMATEVSLVRDEDGRLRCGFRAWPREDDEIRSTILHALNGHVLNYGVEVYLLLGEPPAVEVWRASDHEHVTTVGSMEDAAAAMPDFDGLSR